MERKEGALAHVPTGGASVPRFFALDLERVHHAGCRPGVSRLQRISGVHHRCVA
jgi:hypothetical protein